MNCPICEEGVLEYKPMLNEAYKQVTHVWHCTMCPAMLAEYYGEKDALAIAYGREISKEEANKIIKESE